MQNDTTPTGRVVAVCRLPLKRIAQPCRSEVANRDPAKLFNAALGRRGWCGWCVGWQVL